KRRARGKISWSVAPSAFCLVLLRNITNSTTRPSSRKASYLDLSYQVSMMVYGRKSSRQSRGLWIGQERHPNSVHPAPVRPCHPTRQSNQQLSTQTHIPWPSLNNSASKVKPEKRL